MHSILRNWHCSLLLSLFFLASPAFGQFTITSLAPAPNHQSVVQTTPVAVTFSQELSRGSTGALKVFSSQRGGLRTGRSGVPVIGRSLVFTPSSYPWKPGETVSVTVTRAAQNTATQALSTPKVYQFTAAVGGTGKGIYQRGSQFGVGIFCMGVASGDVDGDGDLDVVSVSSYGFGTGISIRLNGGDASGSNTGIFSGTQQVPSDLSLRSVALGDVDGDGDLDIVTGGSLRYQVLVVLNGGDASGSNTGIFSNLSTLTLGLGIEPWSVALGDVDGDGDLDLLTGNYNPGSVSIRLNGGDASGSNTGQFSGTQNVPIGRFSEGIALGDIDGDGDLDVVVPCFKVNGSFVDVLRNGGDATGSNTGLFATTQEVDVADGPRGVALGDVDGDGDLDIVTANENNRTVGIRLNGGDASGSNTGVFSGEQEVRVVGNPRRVALGDVDADGDLDIVTTEVGQPTSDKVPNIATIRLNGGDASGSNTGVFSGGSSVFVGPEPYNMTLADVDGDNDVDLITAGLGSLGLVTVSLNTPGEVVTATRSSTQKAQLQVFPNPAHQRFTLTLPAVTQAASATLTIYNGLGQAVQTQALPVSAAGNTVDVVVPTLTPGVYRLRVQVGQEISTHTIMLH